MERASRGTRLLLHALLYIRLRGLDESREEGRMKQDDVRMLWDTEYKETCSVCGNIQSVITQDGMKVSEYTTTVYVKCAICGDWIEFILPVN